MRVWRPSPRRALGSVGAAAALIVVSSLVFAVFDVGAKNYVAVAQTVEESYWVYIGDLDLALIYYVRRTLGQRHVVREFRPARFAPLSITAHRAGFKQPPNNIITALSPNKREI